MRPPGYVDELRHLLFLAPVPTGQMRRPDLPPPALANTVVVPASSALPYRLRPVESFGWNYKPAEKHCWLIFCERKILFRLKKQAE
jgi:hypothetical protein